MPCYVTKFRFNRTNEKPLETKRINKRLTNRVSVCLLVILLISASIAVISASACSHGHEEDNQQLDSPPCKHTLQVYAWFSVKSILRLRQILGKLPTSTFQESDQANEQRDILWELCSSAIMLIKAEQYLDALELMKDVEKRIDEWLLSFWRIFLLRKVRFIISQIEQLLCKDFFPPSILTVLQFPETPTYSEPVTVVANVIDAQTGIDTVKLCYSLADTGWTNLTMQSCDGLYLAEIPSHPFNSTIKYQIYAIDSAGNIGVSELASYKVVDARPPIIWFVDQTPNSPDSTEEVIVFAKVTEPTEASGVKNVTLFYQTDDGWQPVDMTLNTFFTGVIPAFSEGTTVKYRIETHDNAGNLAVSTFSSYTVGAPMNRPPVAKFVKSATTVFTNEAVIFNASDSYDPDGTIISYLWDFGDDSFSIGVAPRHAYVDNGLFLVTLTVIDDDGETASHSLLMSVLNRVPHAFFIANLTTPTEGASIRLDAANSFDTDGYLVNYSWDFGDGTNATMMTVDHIYDRAGNYTVTLTITDDDGAGSSTYSTITVIAEEVEWPLAWLAAISLAIVSLIFTLLYALLRRRR